MQTLNQTELDAVSGAFPIVGVLTMGELARAVAEIAAQLAQDA